MLDIFVQHRIYDFGSDVCLWRVSGNPLRALSRAQRDNLDRRRAPGNRLLLEPVAAPGRRPFASSLLRSGAS
jgi:hypothetical protein